MGQSIQLLPERRALGPDVRTHVSLLSIPSAGVSEPTPLAGDSDAGRGNRLSAVHQRVSQVWQPGTPAADCRLAHHAGSAALWPEMAGGVHSLLHGQGASICRLPTPAVLRAGW